MATATLPTPPAAPVTSTSPAAGVTPCFSSAMTHGIAAPVCLAHPPAGEDDEVIELEPGMLRGFDHAGEINARHMRIIAHQPAEPVEDEPVLVVQRGILHAHRDVALRQPLLVELRDLRRDLAVFLGQQKGFEHGQYASQLPF